MVLKSKPRNNLILTERDRLVLSAIYHTGIIAAGHLVRLFFGGMSYGYVRLRMLADAGYVGTDAYKEPVPGTKKRRKITSFYYLKKAGIDYLSGLTQNTLRPPWKNKPHRDKFQEHYRMGELWCSFLEEGVIAKPQHWLPSKFAKKHLGINDFVPLHSVFYSVYRAGNYFDVLYYFDEHTDSRKISKLRNVLPAVDLSGARRHFIICETPKTMKKVLEKFTVKYPESDIYIILKDHAGVLVDYLRDGNVFYQELLNRLNFMEGVRLMPAGPVHPAPYWVRYNNGSKIYLTELITGKLLAMTELKYKAGSVRMPDRLCLYVPSKEYYNSIKFLLPESLDTLHLVYRDREK